MKFQGRAGHPRISFMFWVQPQISQDTCDECAAGHQCWNAKHCVVCSMTLCKTEHAKQYAKFSIYLWRFKKFKFIEEGI